MPFCEQGPLRPGTPLWRKDVGPSDLEAGVRIPPGSGNGVFAAGADETGSHIDGKTICLSPQSIIQVAKVMVKALVQISQFLNDRPGNKGAVSIHCVAGFFTVRIEAGQVKDSLTEAPPQDSAVRMPACVGIHGIACDDRLDAILLHSVGGLKHGMQSGIEQNGVVIEPEIVVKILWQGHAESCMHSMVPEQVASPGEEPGFRETQRDCIQGSILAGIVHNEDLERAICERLREQRIQAPESHLSPIEAGDQHRYPDQGSSLWIGFEGDGTLSCQRTIPFAKDGVVNGLTITLQQSNVSVARRAWGQIPAHALAADCRAIKFFI